MNELKAHKITDWMENKCPLDPDFRGTRKKTEPGGQLLLPDERVFISYSLRVASAQRNFDLLKALIVGARKAMFPKHSKGLLERSYVSGPRLEHTPKRGDYSEYIPKDIKLAKYVIHDYTFPTAGVVFETGVSIGFRRPHILFWNEKLREFSETRIPRALRWVDVKRLSKAEDHPNTWFKQTVDQQCLEAGNIECPFEGWGKCTYQTRGLPSKYVFLRFPQVRHPIETFLRDFIVSELGVPVVTGNELGFEKNRGCAILHCLQNCLYCYVDGGGDFDDLPKEKEKDESYADEMEGVFLLGVVAATEIKCVMSYLDLGKGTPVKMWGQHPIVAYSLSNYETVLKLVAKQLHLRWSR